MARNLIGSTTYGTAVQFNGSTQYLSASVPSTAVDNFTVLCRVKFIALPASSGTFLNSGHDGGGNGQGYYMAVNSAGLLSATYGFVVFAPSATTISVGTWYDVVLRRSGGTSQIYVNGSASGSSWGNTPFFADVGMLLGAQYTSSGGAIGNYANAVVDDVRIYDRALSTTEITAYTNLKSNPDQAIDATSIKLWWKLNEGSGTSTADSSGNGKTGTLVNTPSWVTDNVIVSINAARPLASGRVLATNRTAI